MISFRDRQRSRSASAANYLSIPACVALRLRRNGRSAQTYRDDDGKYDRIPFHLLSSINRAGYRRASNRRIM
jgi:hypothetical protein